MLGKQMGFLTPKGQGAEDGSAFHELIKFIRPNTLKVILFFQQTQTKCMAVLGLYMTIAQSLSWGGFQCVTPLPWVFCGRDTSV